MFFFFKQKTAYEMRISDWSSDVCSSDLEKLLHRAKLIERVQRFAVDILGERILLRRDRVVLAHDARHGFRLRHLALLDERLQRAETAAAGPDFIFDGLVAIHIPLAADGEALAQAAPREAGGERA